MSSALSSVLCCCDCRWARCFAGAIRWIGLASLDGPGVAAVEPFPALSSKWREEVANVRRAACLEELMIAMSMR
jgi:hypothetical protein